MKFFDGRLDQADSAVIAVKEGPPDELIKAGIALLVLGGRDDDDLGVLLQDDPGPKIADGDGDDLAEVAVRRISQQPGPGVGDALRPLHRAPPAARMPRK